MTAKEWIEIIKALQPILIALISVSAGLSGALMVYRQAAKNRESEERRWVFTHRLERKYSVLSTLASAAARLHNVFPALVRNPHDGESEKRHRGALGEFQEALTAADPYLNHESFKAFGEYHSRHRDAMIRVQQDGPASERFESIDSLNQAFSSLQSAVRRLLDPEATQRANG